MATLQNILYKVRSVALIGNTDVEVNGLCIDSRRVVPGNVFIASRGVHTDGHQFIESAIEKGAVAIICEEIPEWNYKHVTYVKVTNAAEACGMMASNFYDNPSEKLILTGVTGTNGKTTVATLQFKLFRSLGYSCGLLSTVSNRINDEVIPAAYTTPDAITINILLADMAKKGCQYAFMEVSSHAIHQQRIAGLHFAGGIFTNITHDHLDYHKTFEEYLRVKKSFFDGLSSTAFALANLDDKNGSVMLQNTQAKKAAYSLKNMGDFKGTILENNLSGLIMNVDGEEVHFRLIGEFNAYNLLAVYGSSVLLGKEKKEVLQHLSALTGAEGRFDYLISPREHIIGIVDYAHTPDALLNVLATIKNLRQGHERIITVAGCGGDRDKTKRPVMGEVAAQYSDKVIFTSDNPRSEDPDTIIREMEAGVPLTMKRKCISVSDRKEAIRIACNLAEKEDIILIAGKGHEKYQEIKGVRHHFDDKETLQRIFEELEK
ncbi:MAG: UDP-N-acetylmuramoyl-L-alanyl-D-glutamate--2,6-diaminopimelate ligase [Chitinophagaceae bacterium]|nr:MAG: UDP-N-acetylmuramoyl-L-alanyl-D-glutamate--2,6-diaminopimelate ligase [Chitinophagaceae bacterium]